MALSQNPEKRENQLANLKPFEKGQPSANPGGRPKKKPFLEEIERWIAAHPEDVTSAIKAIFAAAKRGDLASLNTLMDRVDGPVPKRDEHTGEDGGAIQVEHTIKFGDDKSNEH